MKKDKKTSLTLLLCICLLGLILTGCGEDPAGYNPAGGAETPGTSGETVESAGSDVTSAGDYTPGMQNTMSRYEGPDGRFMDGSEDYPWGSLIAWQDQMFYFVNGQGELCKIPRNRASERDVQVILDIKEHFESISEIQVVEDWIYIRYDNVCQFITMNDGSSYFDVRQSIARVRTDGSGLETLLTDMFGYEGRIEGGTFVVRDGGVYYPYREPTSPDSNHATVGMKCYDLTSGENYVLFTAGDEVGFRAEVMRLQAYNDTTALLYYQGNGHDEDYMMVYDFATGRRFPAPQAMQEMHRFNSATYYADGSDYLIYMSSGSRDEIYLLGESTGWEGQLWYTNGDIGIREDSGCFLNGALYLNADPGFMVVRDGWADLFTGECRPSTVFWLGDEYLYFFDYEGNVCRIHQDGTGYVQLNWYTYSLEY